ncbi:MAG: NRDE family protein [Nitrospirae bacterium]|nr:NRDE family protein [Magnetococcales bacterium]HAT49501.1 hypothetical protein [Alphaproteobacteria bacterium]
MCSVVIHHAPDHAWPLLLAANRDEMMDRPWLEPGRHWPQQPNIIAGKDQRAGGSWLGINERGVVATILNRVGTLGTQPGKHSRGWLVLQALRHESAETSVKQLVSWARGHCFRPFNLIVADHHHAFWISYRTTIHESTGEFSIQTIQPGLHMLTAHDMDDTTDPRIRGYLPQFLERPLPDPDGDWSSWTPVLASQTPIPGGSPQSAMCFALANRFATVSSSLIALPHPKDNNRSPQWLFAGGQPGKATYRSMIDRRTT